MRGYYGKEPFDLRLTVLRLFRSLWLIVAVTLTGTLIFGGGYYVKNVLLRSEPAYSATSTYRVEFAVAEEKDVSTVHINEMTWNTYVDTKLFLDAVRKYLPGGSEYADQELAAAIDAVLASNLKVLSTVVTTTSPDESLKLAAAVETALVQDFPENISEVVSVAVIDPGVSVEEVYPDVRPFRAFVLSALLSFLFIMTVVLLRELGADSIWLPSTLRQRYGLNVLGTLKSPELKENLNYLFDGKKKIAVCPVQERLDPVQVIQELRKACEGADVFQDAEWFAVPAPVLCPESCEALRESDGILLAVAAGDHAGKQLEYVMEYLEQQDCKITAVILWDADETLLAAYYCFRHRE